MTEQPTKPPTLKKKKSRINHTPRQQKLIELVAEGENPSEAGRKAGYPESSAITRTYTFINRPEIQEEIADIRKRNALIAQKLGKGPVERIAKFIALTDAQKIVTASHEGVITDEKVYDDGALQLQAADKLAKLCGDYPADRLEIDDRRPVMVVTTLPDAFEAMRDITPDED